MFVCACMCCMCIVEHGDLCVRGYCHHAYHVCESLCLCVLVCVVCDLCGIVEHGDLCVQGYCHHAYHVCESLCECECLYV